MRKIPDKDINKLHELEGILGYYFNDISHLYQALMHKSYLNEMPELEFSDNERLEFLGDAILQFVVTKSLFDKYPEESEGELTERRACLVDRENCARMGKKLRLDEFVFLGKGERSESKPVKRSILANAFEAVIAAIFLDSGLIKCEKFILSIIDKSGHEAGKGVCRNFKAELQKYVQKKYQKIPEYRDISATGPEHEKIFEVSVWINDKPYGKGKGPNKKTAQQNAAKIALKKILYEEENGKDFKGEFYES